MIQTISEDQLVTTYVNLRLEDDIMYCTYANNLHVSLEVAKAVVESRIYFSKGKDYLLLIDMRGIKSSTKEARRYLATIGATLVKAGALITGSPLNRALGNIFLKIEKPLVPAKLFTCKEKAKSWLATQR